MKIWDEKVWAQYPSLLLPLKKEEEFCIGSSCNVGWLYLGFQISQW